VFDFLPTTYWCYWGV